jgi:hypothetical protein
MALRTLILASTLAVVACSATTVVPEQAAIAERLAQVESRLASLQLAGVDSESFAMSEARAWLELALDANSQGERGTLLREALARADAILRRVECCGGSIHVQDSASISRPKEVRPDLWARLRALQQHEYFTCAQGDIARLRVQLIAAGHAYSDFGWRHARPYVEAANRYTREAEAKVNICLHPERGAEADEPSRSGRTEAADGAPARALPSEPGYPKTPTQGGVKR